jgi:hypothetical protein
MAHFIKAEHGHVNLDLVAYTTVFRNGESVTTYLFDTQNNKLGEIKSFEVPVDLARMTAALVPGGGMYGYLIWIGDDGEVFPGKRMPVIAWRIYGRYQVEPVLLDDIDGAVDVLIEMPGGHLVSVMDGAYYSSMVDALVHIKNVQ